MTDNLPDNIWDQLKLEYLSHAYSTVRDMALRHNVSYNTLNDRIHKGRHGQKPWKVEREEISKELLESAISASQDKYIKVFCMGADIAEKILTELSEKIRDSDLGLEKKTQMFKTTLEGLQKMQSVIRLENNQSTQNISVHRKEERIISSADMALDVLSEYGLVDEKE